jgi:hypothetical protein
MSAQPIHLLDQSRTRIASLSVAAVGSHYEGDVSLDATPSNLMKLFEQYEEIVEGQMFGLLDSIEENIADAGLRVAFEDGTEADVDDLQVFPSRKAISFGIRDTARTGGG